LDEGIFSFYGDRGGGVSEKLKPMPTPIASQNSPDQSLGRNHRRVMRQGKRPRSPDFHGARYEISICATTNQSSGIEFCVGPCKIADFTKGGKVRLEEDLSGAKCLEIDPHFSIFDHSILKTAGPETEVNGEIDRTLGDHGHRFEEGAQPREQNGIAPDRRNLERCQELEQGPHENRSEKVGS
jgi:hypothetical protein